MNGDDFEEAIADLYAALSEAQTPLGPEFTAALADDRHELYEE